MGRKERNDFAKPYAMVREDTNHGNRGKQPLKYSLRLIVGCLFGLQYQQSHSYFPTFKSLYAL
jgi:hypothetical protein